MTNFFKCSGKFAGIINSRHTPGGLKVAEFMLATHIKLSWKTPYYSKLLIKAYDKLADSLDLIKTGDQIYVEGLIEGTGKDKNAKINLIANLIKEEK